MLCCVERDTMPDALLLREAVTDPKDGARLLAALSEKTVGRVEALHLTHAILDSRVVDTTLPLLATFDEFLEALPSKAALDSVDLLQWWSFVCLWSGTFFAAPGGSVVVLRATEFIRRKATWMVSLGRVQHPSGHVGSGWPFVGRACSEGFVRMGPYGWL